MPDDLQERVAEILASAKKVDAQPAQQDPSIAIYGGCVYVAGDLHVEQVSAANGCSVSERRDLELIIKGLVITFCSISMATHVLEIKIGSMLSAVVLTWITLGIGWSDHLAKKRPTSHQ